MGHPTIYPTGVTVYNPEKCWNGFTIFQALEVGAVLMNMNGRENKVWKGVHGFPNKIFPGGYLMTSRGSRDGRYGVQDGLDPVSYTHLMDSHGSMKACLVKFCSLRGNANVMKNPDTPIMTMNSPRLETRG